MAFGGSGLIRGSSDIWPDKKGGLIRGLPLVGGGLIRGVTIIIDILTSLLHEREKNL